MAPIVIVVILAFSSRLWRPPHGAPFINAQPRFGIYRDWRAETQAIYFDKIMFWNADPAGHPDWNVRPSPG